MESIQKYVAMWKSYNFKIYVKNFKEGPQLVWLSGLSAGL